MLKTFQELLCLLLYISGCISFNISPPRTSLWRNNPLYATNKPKSEVERAAENRNVLGNSLRTVAFSAGFLSFMESSFAGDKTNKKFENCMSKVSLSLKTRQRLFHHCTLQHFPAVLFLFYLQCIYAETREAPIGSDVSRLEAKPRNEIVAECKQKCLAKYPMEKTSK